MHPGILPKLADLLVAASQRTQIIITTHSDILVDAMTEHPEAVVVCESSEKRITMAYATMSKAAENRNILTARRKFLFNSYCSFMFHCSLNERSSKYQAPGYLQPPDS